MRKPSCSSVVRGGRAKSSALDRQVEEVAQLPPRQELEEGVFRDLDVLREDLLLLTKQGIYLLFYGIDLQEAKPLEGRLRSEPVRAGWPDSHPPGSTDG
jgi:hypothetical protein